MNELKFQYGHHLWSSGARRDRRGNILLSTIILLPALIGVISLGVDFGRVQLAKSELQDAADAAARYAATGLSGGTAVSKAKSAAAANFALGSSVTLTDSDIVVGNFDSTNAPKFDSTRTPINAVQVTARRSNARGTGVSLVFGTLIGQPTCDVTVTSVSKIDLGIPGGVVALDGFTVKNNLTVATYKSSSYTNPSGSKYDSYGSIGSNGAITAKNNQAVGTVILGPSGSHDLTIGSPATVLAQDIEAPTIDHSAAPLINPGGISKTLAVSGTLTLAPGTYSFTSITIANNGKLTFSGPATVFINGNVTFSNNGEITAYSSIPGNLKIFQKGSGSMFGSSSANSMDVTADLEAPETVVEAKNNLVVRGRIVAKSVTSKNNAELYYDSSLAATITDSGASGAVTMVQ